MVKLKRYLDVYIPIETCNFHCPYCYVHQHREDSKLIWKPKHSLDDIKRAFSINYWGGTCLINLCAGGETLLCPEVIEIIRVLLENGHYVTVVSNGVLSKSFEKIAALPKELLSQLFIKFSFHWSELKRLKLFDVFWSNVKLMQELGVSFTLELAAYDDFIKDEFEIQKMCLENAGGLPHVNPLRDETTNGFTLMTKYSFEEYEKKWESYKSELFDVRVDIMKNKYKGFCYGGSWAFNLNIDTGDIRQCYNEYVIGNIYDFSIKRCPSIPVGNFCRSEYCFACHVFLTLGVIPELRIPYTYASVRERKGTNWLTTDFGKILSQKLYDNNKKISFLERRALIKKHKLQIERNHLASELILNDALQGLIDNNGYIINKSIYYLKEQYPKEKLIPIKLRWINNYNVDCKLINIKSERHFNILCLGNKNENAEGNEIWLLGCIVGEHFFTASQICSGEKLLNKGKLIGWRNYDLPEGNADEYQNISVSIPNANYTRLIFLKNKWQGKVLLSTETTQKEIDCYGKEDNGLNYVDVFNNGEIHWNDEKREKLLTQDTKLSRSQYIHFFCR